MATVISPAGISSAVLLIPFQVSVLGTPSPGVTPTNLLYSVVPTLMERSTAGGIKVKPAAS
jgi:hypothetical protein